MLAVLRYTCRRCHQHREAALATNANPVEALMKMIVSNDQRRDLGLLAIHRCADGGYGISDLIGTDMREG